MNNYYKLKLLSKRLQSGRCQIKFVVSDDAKEKMYGYLLTESGATLRDVVCKIEDKVRQRVNGDVYYHQHLYNLAEPSKHNDNILIFEN